MIVKKVTNQGSPLWQDFGQHGVMYKWGFLNKDEQLRKRCFINHCLVT